MFLNRCNESNDEMNKHRTGPASVDRNLFYNYLFYDAFISFL